MIRKISKDEIRLRIHDRIRQKLKGTSDRPRLAVFRSTKHVYAQVIDDVAGRTLASASTMEPDARGGATGTVDAQDFPTFARRWREHPKAPAAAAEA